MPNLSKIQGRIIFYLKKVNNDYFLNIYIKEKETVIIHKHEQFSNKCFFSFILT